MRKLLLCLTLIIWLMLPLLCALFIPSAHAQNGTQHGVFITFTASTSSVASYSIYQCLGTCTATSSFWTKVNTVPDLSTAYMVPLAGLTPGATYSYAATAVDASGNESVFSNIATVVLPAVLPSNPVAPTNVSVAVR
jgi:hypothetical protein